MRLALMDDFEDGPGGGVLGKLLPAIGAGGFLFDRAALPRPARRAEVAALCAFALNVTSLAERAGKTGARWGWKEPRALFYLPSWGLAFPKFRFLHVARDVRTVGTTHLEGALRAWELYWGEAGLEARERAAAAAIEADAAVAAAADGGAPPLACGRVFHDALVWRLLFARFWADEQLAVAKAGEALGPGRYRLARIEDLSGGSSEGASGADDGAVHSDDLLRWVLGDAFVPGTIVDRLDRWQKTFAGYSATYRHQRPVCDLLVKAAFGDLSRGHFEVKKQRDGTLAVKMQGAQNKVTAFLRRSGAIPADLERKIQVPKLISAAHLRKDRGLAPRIAVVAAVKSQCFAVAADVNALQQAAPGVADALRALGYPADQPLTPSVYHDAQVKRKKSPDQLTFDAVEPTCRGANRRSRPAARGADGR